MENIKDWDKLSIEELANLTDKEVDFYKKLLYANNGIALVEKPKPLDIVDIPKDTTVYCIDMLDQFFFLDLREAEKVAEVLKNCKSIAHEEGEGDWSNRDYYIDGGTPRNYDKTNRLFTISTKLLYSKETFLKVQNTLTTYRNLRKQYDKDKDEYDKVQKQAIEITQEFIDKLNEAKEIISHRKTMTRKYYLDYLPLANNDETIAMNFLKKAYTVDDACEQYIKAHKSDYIDETI